MIKTSSSFLRFIIGIIKCSLPFLISFGCLSLLFSSAVWKINLVETSKILFAMDLRWFGLVFLMTICIILINSFRFAMISQWVANQRPNYSLALKLTWLGYFISLSVPFAAMGDAARAGLIKWQMHLSLSNSIEVVLFDRGYSLYCLIWLTLLSSLYCYQYLNQPWILCAQVLIPLASLIALLAIITIHNFIDWPNNRISHFFSRLLDKLKFLLIQPKYIFVQMLIALCNIALYVVSFLVLAHTLHFSFAIWNLIMFSPVILIVSNLPFFYLGWGGREAIFLMLLPIIAPHTSSELLMATSMGYGVINMLVALCGGCYMLSFFKRTSKRPSQE